MAEELSITAIGKEEKYKQLLPQIKSLLQGESDSIANMANVCAALKYGMNFLWVGFYLVKENELVLGPFQGPIACTRISKGKGVCGKAWETSKTVIVEDVELFPGHIACSSLSKSEIVIPLIINNKVVAVLDVDSDKLSSFDQIDRYFLQEIINLIYL